MPSGVAAAKSGEAGLEFLPVFESPPPAPQRREIRRPAMKQAGSGRGGACPATGEAGAARSGASDSQSCRRAKALVLRFTRRPHGQDRRPTPAPPPATGPVTPLRPGPPPRSTRPPAAEAGPSGPCRHLPWRCLGLARRRPQVWNPRVTLAGATRGGEEALPPGPCMAVPLRTSLPPTQTVNTNLVVAWAACLSVDRVNTYLLVVRAA